MNQSTLTPSYTFKKPPKAATLILEALKKVHHASVQEILDWIKQTYPTRKVGLTTLYRTIHYLLQAHQITRVYLNDGQARYDLASHHSEAHHHHHLVCTGCQNIEVVHDCYVEEIIGKLSTNFQIQTHNLEFFGLCETCQH